MPGRDTVPFSPEAMKASLLRLQNEWETVQASHDRGAIYQYLAAVFELVSDGRWKARQSLAPVERCICEGILRSGSRNRLQP